MMEALVTSHDLAGIETHIETLKSSCAIDLLQTRVDCLLRKHVLEVIASSADAAADVRSTVAFAFELAEKGLCSKTVALQCMADALDVSDIKGCHSLFTIIEENQERFKKLDTTPMLRTCNDLLKRLSRCAETSFCGRILFFLSRFLALAEKSGLNLTGQFNTLNETVYEEPLEATTSTVEAKPKTEDAQEEGELIENKDSAAIVSSELYPQFWQLQSFFSNPNRCYQKFDWSSFQVNMSAVLAAFSAHKLDRPREEERKKDVASTRSDDADSYFAKYLTSPKLFQLQMNDSQFRRSYLVQCLILFQYLMAEVKFKQKTFTLADEQLRFIVEMQEKCYKLLKETHPRGSHFAESVKKILQRENEWSEWKNAGCPDFTKLRDDSGMKKFAKRPRTTFAPDVIDLGTSELNKIWEGSNIGLLEQCKNSRRNFTPTLREFLQDPLDEMDPEQQVDEQYKSIYDSGFQWRCARLLLSQSQQYLSAPTQPHNNHVPTFLSNAIVSTAHDIPELKAQLVARENAARERVLAARALKEKERLSRAESSPAPEGPISTEQVDSLSTVLAGQWTDLASALGLDEEHKEKLLAECGQKTEECVRTLLLQWSEAQSENKPSSQGSTVGEGNGPRELLKFLLNNSLLSEEVTTILKKSPARPKSEPPE